jgi:LacI family gluconate utilization system Gnt-I transcriptional repressor
MGDNLHTKRRASAGNLLRRPQLSDVAKAAGVSVVTVSRAMNAPAIVSSKTRRKIEKAILDTGYVPDLVARSMAQQRTRIVAGFVPTLLDSIFASSIQGLSDAISRDGLQLLLGNTNYDMLDEERLVLAMMGRRPDAVVLTGLSHTNKLRRLLRGAGVPVVEIWSVGASPIDLAVGMINRDAGRAITTHMIARGRRRIGYVSRPTQGNDRARDRRQGYLDALADAGLPSAEEWRWETETTIDAGAEAVERLALAHDLDALVFSGDNTATGALLACMARGIAVPQRLAIGGFGDLPIATMLPGGLTTIRIDAYGIGRKAGELIVAALAGQRPRRRSIAISFELVVRGST